MEYSFPRYLLAKQTVDDRALNKEVLAALQTRISTLRRPSVPAFTFSVIEVGAGIGTMLARLLRWKILPPNVEYTLVDEMPENITFARRWLPQWARENGYQVEHLPEESLRLSVSSSVTQSVSIHFVQADVFDFIRSSASQTAAPSADLLIAHAFLDLLPMPESLPKLFSCVKPGGLAWLTINFDGLTSLEPVIEPALDAKIEQLYHASMDSRPTGGDSRAGRRLFGQLKQASAEILAAGASDWVVYPVHGQYPADEAYFLHFILHFFETSLANQPELDSDLFQEWLKQRRAQIERAELVYIAHQMDFLTLAR